MRKKVKKDKLVHLLPVWQALEYMNRDIPTLPCGVSAWLYERRPGWTEAFWDYDRFWTPLCKKQLTRKIEEVTCMGCLVATGTR
jgi:hypothetical protein